jgi:hypothetical protein
MIVPVGCCCSFEKSVRWMRDSCSLVVHLVMQEYRGIGVQCAQESTQRGVDCELTSNITVPTDHTAVQRVVRHSKFVPNLLITSNSFTFRRQVGINVLFVRKYKCGWIQRFDSRLVDNRWLTWIISASLIVNKFDYSGSCVLRPGKLRQNA